MIYGKLLTAQAIEFGKNERSVATLFLGCAMGSYFSSRYLRFANLVSMPINPLESFIIMGSDRNGFTCVTFFALMLLTFDAPYFSNRSIYEITRTGLHRWLASKIIFVALTVFLYQMIVLSFTTMLSAFSVPEINWLGWSPAMGYLQGPGQQLATRQFMLHFPYPGFTQILSPGVAVIITIAYNGAYCLILALIMICSNTYLGNGKGWPLAMGIHILGYVITNNGQGLLFHFDFSLLNCALPGWQFHNMSALNGIVSIVIFVVLLFLMVLLIFKIRTDVHYET